MLRTAALIALAGPMICGCSHFSIFDAARQIAFDRGCDPREVTVLEGERAVYEADRCGDLALYQCSGGRCQPVSTRDEPNPIVTRAVQAMRAHEGEILACTQNQPVTVQLYFDDWGHAHIRPGFVQPEQPPESRSCVARVFATPIHIGRTRHNLLVTVAFPDDEAAGEPGSTSHPN